METRATAARRAAASTPAPSASASIGASAFASAAPSPSAPAATAASAAAASSARPAAPAAGTRSTRGKRRREESPGAQPQEEKGDVAVAPTASAAAAAAVSVASSPLLRCMRGCRDIQFHLMQLLRLEDLAALDGTCHSWREWLLHPPLIDGLDHDVVLARLPSLLPCEWARRMLASVTTDLEDDPPEEPVSAAQKRKARAACDELLLRVLPRFPRLHEFQLQLCHSVLKEETLRRSFAAQAGQLKSLLVWTYGAGDDLLLNRVLQQAPRLTKLKTLWVEVDEVTQVDWTAVDFSPLPHLPALASFTCSMDDEWLTATQVACLAQCRSLTFINCGSWSPGAEADPEAQRQQIEQGIATLVRSRLPSGADGPNANVACAPLLEVDLSHTDLSAAVWEHVSLLTTLESLEPDSWRSDITPAQWVRFVHFKQLEDLKIWPHPADVDSPLLTDHFLPHALLCTAIRCLEFGSGLRLSRLQLQSIARQLPRLDILNLHGVWLEDVAPLAEAANLIALTICYCDGPRAAGGPPVQFRSLLPSLKRLEELILYDRCRITEEQATPLNAALLARMPTLAMDDFQQNLLPSVPMPDTAALEQFAAEAATPDDDEWDEEMDEEMDDDMDDEWEEEQELPLFGPAWEH